MHKKKNYQFAVPYRCIILYIYICMSNIFHPCRYRNKCAIVNVKETPNGHGYLLQILRYAGIINKLMFEVCGLQCCDNITGDYCPRPFIRFLMRQLTRFFLGYSIILYIFIVALNLVDWRRMFKLLEKEDRFKDYFLYM